MVSLLPIRLYLFRRADKKNQYSPRETDGDLYLIIGDKSAVLGNTTWKSRETAVGAFGPRTLDRRLIPRLRC